MQQSNTAMAEWNERLEELFAEMLIRLDKVVDEQKGMRAEQVAMRQEQVAMRKEITEIKSEIIKLNLITQSNSRAVIDLADQMGVLQSQYGDRIMRLEDQVFGKAS